MDFGTLKSRLLAQIGRAPSDLCYELCTADINQSLRLQCMVSSTTLVEAAEITLPADFLAVADIYRDTDPRGELRPTSSQGLNRVYETTGVPRFYDIKDGKMRLTPAPNGSDNIKLRYYAKLADFSADSDTNDVLTLFPAIYVYGVLKHHATLIRDEKAMAFYDSAFGRAGRQAGASDTNDQYSGGPLAVVVQAAP